MYIAGAIEGLFIDVYSQLNIFNVCMFLKNSLPVSLPKCVNTSNLRKDM